MSPRVKSHGTFTVAHDPQRLTPAQVHERNVHQSIQTNDFRHLRLPCGSTLDGEMQFLDDGK